MSQPRMQLIQLRKSRKLKQKDIASAIGMTTSYYGMIELGTRTPGLKQAQKIAEFFGQKVEDIFFNNSSNILLNNEKSTTSDLPPTGTAD